MFLQGLGYIIVDRNWRNRCGEIDIVARKDDFLVFIEVKTLPKGNAEMLSHELDIRKRKKIIKASKAFLYCHKEFSDFYVRYDVIVIDFPGYPPVYHIENAFVDC